LVSPWYWGLGIRITPKGMLYNIQSRKALALRYVYQGKEKEILIGSKDRSQLETLLKANFVK